MEKRKTICTFSGSSLGQREAYTRDAALLGRLIGENNFDLVYGGGAIGLMGIVADEAKKHGSFVLGVLPESMNKKEVRVKNVESELLIVKDMHERKRTMYQRGDFFVALPGGIGTFEELMEIFTWKQLGYHKKGIVLLNTENYYSSLIQQFERAVSDGFLKEEVLSSICVAQKPEDVLSYINGYKEEKLPEKI